MTAVVSTRRARRSRRAFWLKQLHTWHWISSAVCLIGMLLFAFIFLKVVYVSIPRGEPPFDQVTQFVMDLMKI